MNRAILRWFEFFGAKRYGNLGGFVVEPKFRFREIVRIVAQPANVNAMLVNKEGTIVGMSEPKLDSRRDYGVHISEYDRTFAISEQWLQTTGRIKPR